MSGIRNGFGRALEGSRMVTLFISHIWYDSHDTYARFVGMLESVPGFHWENVSITESQAVTIWQDGENAHRQKRDLHKENAKNLASQIAKCYKRLKDLDDLATLEQRIANHDKATKRKLHD